MPKGVYQKQNAYRRTTKLSTGITILRAHDLNFKMGQETTNEQVYERMREFGFKWNDGMWFKPINGQVAQPVQPISVPPPGADGHLEVIIREADMNTVQPVIDAMHTLGFTVEVLITGTPGAKG